MKEFDKIFEGQSASFKRILCKNTEHINGVLLGVGNGQFAGQDKFVPHKDGSVHFDTDIFLNPEKYPPIVPDLIPEPKPQRHPLQGEFILTRSPRLKELKLA